MQAMISHEYRMATRVLGVKGVRKIIEGGYGTVKIGNGLGLQGLLLSGHYQTHLKEIHLNDSARLDDICKQARPFAYFLRCQWISLAQRKGLKSSLPPLPPPPLSIHDHYAQNLPARSS